MTATAESLRVGYSPFKPAQMTATVESLRVGSSPFKPLRRSLRSTSSRCGDGACVRGTMPPCLVHATKELLPPEVDMEALGNVRKTASDVEDEVATSFDQRLGPSFSGKKGIISRFLAEYYSVGNRDSGPSSAV